MTTETTTLFPRHLVTSYGRVCTCVKQGLWLYKIVGRWKDKGDISDTYTIAMPSGFDMAERRDMAWHHALDHITHHFVSLTWDTYDGMVQDVHFGWGVSNDQAPKKGFRTHHRLDDLFPGFLAGTVQECFESLRDFRNHISHGSGYIDHELSGEDKFVLRGLKGASLEGLLRSDMPNAVEPYEIKTFRTSETCDGSTNRRAWVELSFEQFDATVSSIAALARLTLKKFELEHPQVWQQYSKEDEDRNVAALAEWQKKMAAAQFVAPAAHNPFAIMAPADSSSGAVAGGDYYQGSCLPARPVGMAIGRDDRTK